MSLPNNKRKRSADAPQGGPPEKKQFPGPDESVTSLATGMAMAAGEIAKEAKTRVDSVGMQAIYQHFRPAPPPRGLTSWQWLPHEDGKLLLALEAGEADYRQSREGNRATCRAARQAFEAVAGRSGGRHDARYGQAARDLQEAEENLAEFEALYHDFSERLRRQRAIKYQIDVVRQELKPVLKDAVGKSGHDFCQGKAGWITNGGKCHSLGLEYILGRQAGLSATQIIAGIRQDPATQARVLSTQAAYVKAFRQIMAAWRDFLGTAHQPAEFQAKEAEVLLAEFNLYRNTYQLHRSAVAPGAPALPPHNRPLVMHKYMTRFYPQFSLESLAATWPAGIAPAPTLKREFVFMAPSRRSGAPAAGVGAGGSSSSSSSSSSSAGSGRDGLPFSVPPAPLSRHLFRNCAPGLTWIDRSLLEQDWALWQSQLEYIALAAQKRPALPFVYCGIESEFGSIKSDARAHGIVLDFSSCPGIFDANFGFLPLRSSNPRDPYFQWLFAVMMVCYRVRSFSISRLTQAAGES